MKVDEIKDLSVVELQKRLADEEESLANLRFQLATSQLESPIKVRTVRTGVTWTDFAIFHPDATRAQAPPNNVTLITAAQAHAGSCVYSMRSSTQAAAAPNIAATARIVAIANHTIVLKILPISY